MAIIRNIEIDGRPVPFKASAALPRIYRIKYGRDIFADVARLAAAIGEDDEAFSSLDTLSLETFEDIAYTMAKYADPSVPDTPEEWLDEFNTFSIYEVMPQIIDLWGMNVETMVDSKKNEDRPTDH